MRKNETLIVARDRGEAAEIAKVLINRVPFVMQINSTGIKIRVTGEVPKEAMS